MDPKRIVALVVGASVMVLIFSALLVPIINDATTTEKTFKNEGLWRMKEIENGDIWTRTTETGWSFGDEAITATGGSNVLLGDDWCIRAVGHMRSSATVNASTNLNNATVTAGEELIVASKTDTTWTRNLNYPGYGVDPNGAYTMSAFEGSAYLNGDSIIYGSGVSEVDSVQIFVHVTGTVDDGVTFTVTQSSGSNAISDVTITNTTVNYTAVSGYDDLYNVTGVTCDISFTATIDDVATQKTGTIAFSSYVIPYEVTAELTVHPDSATNALISAIPIIAMIGIVLAVVGVAIVGRNDY